MVALNFPSSPAINDTHVHMGRVYVWDGTAWVCGNPLSYIGIKYVDTRIDSGNVLSPVWECDYKYQPGSAPAGTLVVPARRTLDYATAENLTGGGHVVAGLDHAILSGAGNPNLAISHESKLTVSGAASVLLAIGSEHNVNITNAGADVSSLQGFRSSLSSNLGNVDVWIPHGVNVDSNAGTVGVVLAYHFPDLSGISGITSKRFLYNQDATAYSESAAPSFGPVGLATGQEKAPMPHGGYVTGRYYFPPGHKTPYSQALAANTLYAVPFPISRRTTFTKIGVRVTTAEVAKNARLGIYKMANGVPSTLVLDAGTVSVAATGAVEITISQVLEAGVYALAIVTDATAAAINFSVVDVGMLSWVVGAAADDTADGSAEGLMYGAHTYGALPGNFPAVSYFGAGIQPRLWLRQ